MRMRKGYRRALGRRGRPGRAWARLGPAVHGHGIPAGGGAYIEMSSAVRMRKY